MSDPATFLAERKAQLRRDSNWHEVGSQKLLALMNIYPDSLVPSPFATESALEEWARETGRLDAEFRAEEIGAEPCGPLIWAWSEYRQWEFTDKETGEVFSGRNGWVMRYERMHRLLP